MEAQVPEAPPMRKDPLLRWISNASLALVSGVVVWLIVGPSIDLRTSRVLLVLAFFLVFKMLIAWDTGQKRVRGRKWYPPVAVASDAAFLGVALLAACLMEDSIYFGLFFPTFIALLVTAALFRLALLLSALTMLPIDRRRERGVMSSPFEKAMAKTTVVVLHLAVVFFFLGLVLQPAVYDWLSQREGLGDGYRMINLVLLILAGVGFVITMLLAAGAKFRALRGADQR